MENYFIYYFLLINILGFLMMYKDKRNAIKKKWRIREKRLWFIALLGGALAMACSMYIFRHKTKHLSFQIGLPIIALLQTWMLVFLVYQ